MLRLPALCCALLAVLPPLHAGPPADMILIPAGTFSMGSPEDEPGRFNRESPQHTVTLTRPFHLQRTVVTWAQWTAVRAWALRHGYADLTQGQMGSHGDDRNSPDDPVTEVNWHDAAKWCNARSEMEGLQPVYTVDGEVYRHGEAAPDCAFTASGYRLPTEAEWEYAARAGTTTAFHTGPIIHPLSPPSDPNLDRAGWYTGNSGRQSHPVGLKEANAWGLHDMHGGVLEWCWNWFEDYAFAARTDPTGPAAGFDRSYRGGSWSHSARACRSAYRYFYGGPEHRSNNLGFRPARTAAAASAAPELTPPAPAR
jgi:formylglycine-generating enzyme required for sulfatase activity